MQYLLRLYHYDVSCHLFAVVLYHIMLVVLVCCGLTVLYIATYILFAVVLNNCINCKRLLRSCTV